MRYGVSLTNFNDGVSRSHLIRYFTARGFVDPGDTVKDAACGTGYGSNLLSQVAKKVYAYDQIEAINPKHQQDNIEYQKVDLQTYTDYPETDVTISLETIEHLTKEGSEHFIKRVLDTTKRWFIYSVPTGEELGGNPYHLQVFNPKQARSLVQDKRWKPFHSLMQGGHFIGVYWRE